MTDFPWKIWNGELLTGEISFDTETTVVDLKREIPELVLAVVTCDGVTPYIIPHFKLREFLHAHLQSSDLDWVFHNVAFDFHVLDQFLSRSSNCADESMVPPGYGCELLRARLWALADQGAFHDTMLMDQLVRLAKGAAGQSRMNETDEATDRTFGPRNLGKVSEEYAPQFEADKNSPFRMRFGELLPLPESDWPYGIEQGFLDYAAMDALATWHCWQGLREQSLALHPDLSHVDIDHSTHPTNSNESVGDPPYGWLSEKLQVCGAIALRSATLRGLLVDAELAAKTEIGLRQQLKQDWEYLEEHHPLLFSYKKRGEHAGEMELTPKGGTPKLSQKIIRETLTEICKEKQLLLPISCGKTRQVSLRADDWKPYAGKHPFIDCLIHRATLTKLLGYFAGFRKADSDGRLHPEYTVIKQTGRTSSWGDLNIQNIPKGSELRKIFVASPGHIFLITDYAAAELRTLAAICKEKFGFSKLGEVIAEGRDPHVHTASLVTGLSYEEVLAGVNAEKQLCKNADLLGLPKPPTPFSDNRQASKALAFGIPGGLGPAKLVEYAKLTYKVTMTEEQAAELKHRFVTEIYPEVGLYLQDDRLETLSLSLRLNKEKLRYFFASRKFGTDDKLGMLLYCMGQVAQGTPIKKDGVPYKERWTAQLWEYLAILSGMSPTLEPEYRKQISRRHGSDLLYERLFGNVATTLTGRVRAGCGYCDGKNTPFQGLAADAAKLALWRIVQMRYKLCAFIHDEFINELLISTAHQDKIIIERIICEAMEEVTNNHVPVAVESKLSPCWNKA